MNLYFIECDRYGMSHKAVVACRKIQDVSKFIGWDDKDSEDIEIQFIGKAEGYEDPTLICLETP